MAKSARFERLAEVEGGRARSWVIREDNNGHYHAVVRLDESPMVLSLFWKEGRASQPRLVGHYRLDLFGLLEDGYIRVEETRDSMNDVRLRFVTNGSQVSIQVNEQGPALKIGSIPH